MGAYGIYIIVLTIGFLIYFGIVISLDLYSAGKVKDGKSTEVIRVGDAGVVPDDDEDGPTRIEGGEIFGGDNVPGEGVPGSDDEEALTVEEIARMQTEELYKESMGSKDQMERIQARAQVEYSVTTENEELVKFFAGQIAEETAKLYEKEDEEEEL